MIDQKITLGGKRSLVTLEQRGQIGELYYPTQVEPNMPFDVTYKIENYSASDYTFYTYIEDGAGILSGSEWGPTVVPAGTTTDVIIYYSDGIDTAVIWTLTLGHLEEELEICQWIIEHGGYDNISVPSIFELVDAFILQTPPIGGYTFIPTVQQIFGVVDYFLEGNGDSGTGCNFYGG